MKVLLDECLPLDFRHDLRGHDAHTAQWAGFKGKKNGQLLQAAEAAGYDYVEDAVTGRLLTFTVASCSGIARSFRERGARG